MRTTRTITVLLAALLSAAILARARRGRPDRRDLRRLDVAGPGARRSAHRGDLGLRLGLGRHRRRCRGRSIRDRARRLHRHASPPGRPAPVRRHPLTTTNAVPARPGRRDRRTEGLDAGHPAPGILAPWPRNHREWRPGFAGPGAYAGAGAKARDRLRAGRTRLLRAVPVLGRHRGEGDVEAASSASARYASRAPGRSGS